MNNPSNNNKATYIDATGLTCPMPLVLLKQAIDQLPVGAEVKIDVTDEHAELDFEIWCERFGHQLTKTAEVNEVMTFQVTVTEPE